MDALTVEQRRRWQTDGYLHLEGVLDEDQVSFFSDEIDRIRAVPGWEPKHDPELPIGHYAWLDHATDLDPGGFMDRRDLLPYHQAFIDLVDASPVFDYIVDIMGPNILLSMTQAVVRPADSNFPGYTHTDGGESLRLTRVSESSPPIAMKAMYLLTDVPTGNCGNLTVFPGSHLRQIPYQGDRTMTPYSPGAAQLTGKAGDVYLFPHALWHGPSRNESGNARKVLLYNYCQLWVRCYDFGAIPDIAQRTTPRQRRLLGDLGYDFRPGSYFYVPKDQEAVIRS
ncbi:MAG: phytanoyl-CoA dioxygenase family protein [Gammaproteobacteria bacterium]|nr:phytanoyl-CoA dioxygenase family protein [Gammaproteobacteria bacterium]